MLALGSGAQTLARAPGGVQRVRRRWRRSVCVTTTEPRLISPGRWLAWQDEVIRLPPRAEVLAHDRVVRQAFRVHRHLGVQLHPEVTPEIVGEWIASSHEVLDVQAIMEATGRDFGVASPAAHRMFSGFFDSLGETSSVNPRPGLTLTQAHTLPYDRQRLVGTAPNGLVLAGGGAFRPL